MEKKIRAFGDTETEKYKFQYQENLISIDDVDIEKIWISNKIYFRKKGFKYFIGYKDNENVKPLYIILPKMRGYSERFNETKYMSF